MYRYVSLEVFLGCQFDVPVADCERLPTCRVKRLEQVEHWKG